MFPSLLHCCDLDLSGDGRRRLLDLTALLSFLSFALIHGRLSRIIRLPARDKDSPNKPTKM